MTTTHKTSRNIDSILDTVTKQEAVVYYNSGKQGIDISDQLASYHTSVRKSVRWYHKVAEELIFGTAVVNAF